MATVKVKFRASSVATKEGTLFYQVIHKRIVRQIHTGYKLFPAEWDAIHSEVILPSATSESRRDYLLSLKNSLMEDSIRLKNIITRLERSGIAYTSDSLVELYCASTENNGFVSFTLNLIKELNQVGKHRTAETYMTTLNSFIRFRKGKDVLLEEVDSSLMMKYESFLKSTGICPNTTSYYMRNLRAIYNRAVEKDLTVQRSPFKYVYTGIDKTVKRAIPLEEIRRLRELDLTKSPSLAYARDIFMFSFYTRDSSLMMKYESYLKSTGICPNTTSYYMRNLRAIYNRAVEKGLTVQRSPFKYVYTGIDKTVKRAIPLEEIRRLKELDLTKSPSLAYARDIFMFSFYTRGMSFIDMAFLRKKDLQNGILSYRRQKTGQQLFIKWEKPMQEIIDRYDTQGSPYLLPIIRDMEVDGRKQYKKTAHLVNQKLKKLGMRLGLSIPLTTYVARHAWASIAKSKNISLSVISEAMGHDSENTTRIYLASLDTSLVDKANSLILKSL